MLEDLLGASLRYMHADTWPVWFRRLYVALFPVSLTLHLCAVCAVPFAWVAAVALDTAWELWTQKGAR